MKTRNSVVIGLFLGDETKGATTEFLASRQKTNSVIKVSGGAQTAHNVVTSDGKHHTFAQFGSGTFLNIKTILSRFVLVNPIAMAKEAAHLEELLGFDPFNLMFVSENALLNTSLHSAANKLREVARGADRHGSCGFGVGETRYYRLHEPDAPTVADLRNLPLLREKLEAYKAFIEPEVGDLMSYSPTVNEIVGFYEAIMEDHPFNIVSDSWIEEQIRTGYNVFEASQGVLLDENLGFHPHTTWSKTTSENAFILSREAGVEVPEVVGCLRSYATRHGAGPFPSELPYEEWVEMFPELHNKKGNWTGGWRAGHLDLVLLDYAIRATGGIDTLSLSHLDYPYTKAVIKYDELTELIPANFYNVDRLKQEEFTQKLASEAFKESARYVEIKDEEHLLQLLKPIVGDNVKLIKSYGPTLEDREYSTF